MSDATTAAPAASPTPDTATAPAAAPAPAASAPAAAPAPTAAPAASPAPTPAPTAAPAATPKADDKPTGAPEAYAEFTMPEGFKADAETIGEFGTLAKELNLTQEQAQKLVDFQGKAQGQVMAAQLDAIAQEWTDQTKADKEIGGDKFDENLAVAKTALDKFATPEFRTFLDASKLGQHPEMVRLMFRVGQAISQDGFVPGRGGNAAPSAQRMYANSNMNP